MRDIIARQRSEVERIKALPLAEPRQECECCNPLRYDSENDRMVCLACEESALEGMTDALGSYVPKTKCCNETCPDYHQDGVIECSACITDGPPCSNGVRGEQKHGDPKDCRCPGCCGDRVDAAMDLLGE